MAEPKGNPKSRRSNNLEEEGELPVHPVKPARLSKKQREELQRQEIQARALEVVVEQPAQVVETPAPVVDETPAEVTIPVVTDAPASEPTQAPEAAVVVETAPQAVETVVAEAAPVAEAVLAPEVFVAEPEPVVHIEDMYKTARARIEARLNAPVATSSGIVKDSKALLNAVVTDDAFMSIVAALTVEVDNTLTRLDEVEIDLDAHDKALVTLLESIRDLNVARAQFKLETKGLRDLLKAKLNSIRVLHGSESNAYIAASVAASNETWKAHEDKAVANFIQYMEIAKEDFMKSCQHIEDKYGIRVNRDYNKTFDAWTKVCQQTNS